MIYLFSKQFAGDVEFFWEKVHHQIPPPLQNNNKQTHSLQNNQKNTQLPALVNHLLLILYVEELI
jgi:hypothetical protein